MPGERVPASTMSLGGRERGGGGGGGALYLVKPLCNKVGTIFLNVGHLEGKSDPMLDGTGTSGIISLSLAFALPVISTSVVS